MAATIKFDSENNVISPTFVLANRSGEKFGVIPAYDIVFKENLMSGSEVVFKVDKFDNLNEYQLWDSLKDFSLMWCKEWDIWFELSIELSESNGMTKYISAVSIGEAELSQINLNEIEINTEDDISREDYIPTVLFDETNANCSLLNRIMEKAPHYSIIHVDNSISSIQRTFTFDNISIYDTQDLTPILRATVPTVNKTSANLGEAITINLPRTNANFKHKLKYAVGATTWEIDGIYDTSCVWTIPIELAESMSTLVTTQMGIDCYTYKGSTQIGNAQRIYLTINVPSKIIPTITSFQAVPMNEKSIIDKWGICVLGFSRVRLVCEASGIYNSKISDYIFSGEYSETNAYGVYTSGLFTRSGTRQFDCVVKDSRGRLSEKSTVYIDVSPYSYPTISEFMVERNSSQKNQIIVKLKYSFASVNNYNSASAILYYKTTDSNWVEYGEIANNETTILSNLFDETSSYDFKVIVTDSLDSTAISETFISTAPVLLDFRAGGKGLGIGKIAESDSLEIAFITNFYDDIYVKGILLDYIVEQGESDGWKYKKWRSGKYECWCIKDFGDIDISTQNGNMYIGNTPYSLPYPITFQSIENVSISPMTTGYSYFSPTSEITISELPILTLMRPTSDTKKVVLSIKVTGIV